MRGVLLLFLYLNMLQKCNMKIECFIEYSLPARTAIGENGGGGAWAGTHRIIIHVESNSLHIHKDKTSAIESVS